MIFIFGIVVVMLIAQTLITLGYKVKYEKAIEQLSVIQPNYLYLKNIIKDCPRCKRKSIVD